MNPNQKRSICEALDVRRFLTGITLITHGFQSDGVMPQWVERMAEGVDRRIEPAATQAQDAFRIGAANENVRANRARTKLPTECEGPVLLFERIAVRAMREAGFEIDRSERRSTGQLECLRLDSLLGIRERCAADAAANPARRAERRSELDQDL